MEEIWNIIQIIFFGIVLMGGAGEAKTVGITYGADNKSFTVNASNADNAMNTTSGHGYLKVEY